MFTPRPISPTKNFSCSMAIGIAGLIELFRSRPGAGRPSAQRAEDSRTPATDDPSLPSSTQTSSTSRPTSPPRSLMRSCQIW